MPLVAAGAGLVVGIGGALGWQLFQDATMDSAMKTERAERQSIVATTNQQLAAAAKDFGSTSPDAVVLAYLQALAAGEVNTTFEKGFVDQGVSTTLLTTDAYSAVRDRLHAPVVAESHVDADSGTATVTAQYRVGPNNDLVSDDFAVRRDGDTWVLNDSALVVVPIDVDRAGTVTIAGTDVTKDLTDKDGSMSGKVALLPGQYDTGFTEKSGFWGAGVSSVVVSTEAAPARFSVTTTVARAVTDEVQAAAQAQLNAWSDQCVDSRLVGETCSVAIQEEGRYIADKVVHRIYVQEYPAVTVTWNPGTNTFGYRGVGMVTVEGVAVDGGPAVRPASLRYLGTATWHGPGDVEIALGFG